MKKPKQLWHSQWPANVDRRSLSQCRVPLLQNQMALGQFLLPSTSHIHIVRGKHDWGVGGCSEQIEAHPAQLLQRNPTRVGQSAWPVLPTLPSYYLGQPWPPLPHLIPDPTLHEEAPTLEPTAQLPDSSTHSTTLPSTPCAGPTWLLSQPDPLPGIPQHTPNPGLGLDLSSWGPFLRLRSLRSRRVDEAKAAQTQWLVSSKPASLGFQSAIQ